MPSSTSQNEKKSLDVIHRENLISAKEAAQIFGCSSDYIGQFCRQGKIKSIKENRSWFVDKDSLLAFKEQKKIEKKQQSEELSKQRHEDYVKELDQNEFDSAAQHRDMLFQLAVLPTLIIALFFMNGFNVFAQPAEDILSSSKGGYKVATNFVKEKSKYGLEFVNEKVNPRIYQTASILNPVDFLTSGISDAVGTFRNGYKRYENFTTNFLDGYTGGINFVGEQIADLGLYKIYINKNVDREKSMLAIDYEQSKDSRNGEVVDNSIDENEAENSDQKKSPVPKKTKVSPGNNSVAIQNQSAKETILVSGISWEYLENRLASFKNEFDSEKQVLVKREVVTKNLDRVYDSIGESSRDAAKDAVTGGGYSFSGIDGNFSGNITAINGTFSGDVYLNSGLYDSSDSIGTDGYLLQTTGTSTEWVPASTFSINSLTAFDTDDLNEGSSNLYFTDARARQVFSNSATGLSYATSTGDLTLVGGYEIPTTASTTDWNSKVSSQWVTSGSDVYYNSGNVGIGTDSPDYTLDVIGQASFSGAWGAGGGRGVNIRNTTSSGYSELIFDNDTAPSGSGAFVFGYGGTATANPNNAYFWNRRAGAVMFGTSATERMRIDSSGNVGIGTTAPEGLLHISASSSGAYIEPIVENTATVGAAGFAFRNSQQEWKIGVNVGDDYRIRDESNGANVLTIEDGAGTNALYIANGGNVGIGNNNPDVKLDVAGQIYAESASYPVMGFRRETTASSGPLDGLSGIASAMRLETQTSGNMGEGFGGGIVFQLGDSGVDAASNAGARLYARRGSTDESAHFQIWTGTGGTQSVFHLDEDGSLGLGTTAPTYKLDVLTTAGNDVFNFQNDEGDYLRMEEDGDLSYYASGGSRMTFDATKMSVNTTKGISAHQIGNQTSTAGLLISNLNNASNSKGVDIYSYYKPIRFFADDGAATERMRIETDGSVGIGNAAPNEMLNVTKNQSGDFTKIRVENSSAGISAGSAFEVESDSGFLTGVAHSSGRTALTRAGVQLAGWTELLATSDTNGLLIDTQGDDPVVIGANNIEVARFTPEGNVGIGTTNPQSTLHLASSDRVTQSFQDTGISTPFTGLYDSGTIGALNQAYTANGGLTFQGFTNQADKTAFFLQGHVGSASPTVPAVQIQGWKLDGTDRVAMTGTEKILGISGGGNSDVATFLANGNVGIGTANPSAPFTIYKDGLGNIGSFLLDQPTIPTGSTATGPHFFFKSGGIDRGWFGYFDSVSHGSGVDLNLRSAGDVRIGASIGAAPDMIIKTGGNVGIGTISPNEKLHVYGDMKLGDGNDTTFTYDSQALGDASRFIVQPTSGTGQLEIRPASDSTDIPGLVLQTTHDGALDSQAFVLGKAAYALEDQVWHLAASVNGDATANSLPIAFSVSNTSDGRFEALRVANSGNIGIGTTNPSALLDVELTTDNYMRFAEAGVAHLNLVASYNSAPILRVQGTGTADLVNIFDGSNEVFTILDGGNVGIGTTTPSGTLDITSSGSDTPLVITKASEASTRERLFEGSISDSGNDAFFIGNGTSGNGRFAPSFQSYLDSVNNVYSQSFWGMTSAANDVSDSALFGLTHVAGMITDNATDPTNGAFSSPTNRKIFTVGGSGSADIYLTVAASGNLKLNTYGAGTLTTDASGNVTASSDARLKNLQGEFTRGLEDIINITPQLYKWNADSGLETNGLYAGFIAQDVQNSIPEAVGEGRNGFLTLQDRPILAASVNAIKELNLKTILNANNTSELDDDINVHIISIDSEINSLRDISQGLVLYTASSTLLIEENTGKITEIFESIDTIIDRIDEIFATVESLGANVVDGVVRFSSVFVTTFRADEIESERIQTNEICVGETCFTEKEFKEFVEYKQTTEPVEDEEAAIIPDIIEEENDNSTTENASTTESENSTEPVLIETPEENIDSALDNSTTTTDTELEPAVETVAPEIDLEITPEPEPEPVETPAETAEEPVIVDEITLENPESEPTAAEETL